MVVGRPGHNLDLRLASARLADHCSILQPALAGWCTESELLGLGTVSGSAGRGMTVARQDRQQCCTPVL